MKSDKVFQRFNLKNSLILKKEKVVNILYALISLFNSYSIREYVMSRLLEFKGGQ